MSNNIVIAIFIFLMGLSFFVVSLSTNISKTRKMILIISAVVLIVLSIVRFFA